MNEETSNTKSIILIVAVLGIGIALYIWQTGGLNIPDQSEKTSISTESQEWSQRPVGTLGLSLDAPGEFILDEEDLLGEELSEFYEIAEYYLYEDPTENFLIGVSSILYIPSIEADLDGAAEGAFEGFSEAPGIEDVTHTEETITIADKEVHISHIEFTAIGLPSHQKIVTIVDGPKLWQVMIAYELDNFSADAQRIIDSIAIE